MKKLISTAILTIFLISASFSQQSTLVLIKTSLGDIKIKLYNETPKHRDNFIKLVNNKYYDGLLFHRVIKDFMIQTGDPKSRNASKTDQLGGGGPGYTIPAEFNSKLIHKKGAIAAARTGDEINPLKASSGSQFYIVIGKVYSDDGLNQIEAAMNTNIKKKLIRDYIMQPENKALRTKIEGYQKAGNLVKLDSMSQVLDKMVENKYKLYKFSDQQRKIYKTVGGTPFLDMNYTVFGEVVQGMDVVEKIGAAQTLPGDRPVNDIKIISARIVQQ